jgi:hypothetical protein
VVVPILLNERTQSPFEATVIVTPVESLTSAEQEPFDTAAACAGDTVMGDGIAKTEAVRTATIPENRAMRLHIRVDLFTSGSVDCLASFLHDTCTMYTI